MSYFNPTIGNAPTTDKTNGTILYCGLLLLFIFEYFNPVKFLPSLVPLRLNTVIPILTLSVMIMTGGFKIFQSKQSYLYAALAILVIFSIMHALIQTNAFEKTKVFVGYLIFYFLIINTVTTIKRFSGVIWTLIIIHLLLAGLNPEYLDSKERSIGLVGGYFIGNGNDYSLSLIVWFPFVIYLFYQENRITKKIIIGCCGIILLVLIIVAESRASALAMAAMMLYMWFRMKYKLLASIILGVVLIGIVAFASQSYISRIESIQHYAEDTSARGRLDAWRAGIEMTLDHPILGVGAGNFNSVYGRYYRPADAVHARWISPHSTYIQCMAELGFTGLILFIGIFFYNYKLTSKMRKILDDSTKIDRGLLILPVVLEMSMIGFCINAAFLGAFYYPHHFVLSGLTVTLMNILDRRVVTVVQENHYRK